MKKVITNEILREKMKIAVNLLCDTVKTTLGPKGSNSIIDHSSFSPFITNDGVTIAQNIESEDECVNTILEIAKEAAINTNEKVGDGTTTTLVLLESLFNQGIEFIENGKNPIVLKKELDENLPVVLNYIKSRSIKPSPKDLYNIARIASGSDVIGNIVADALIKVGNAEAITIKESRDLKTSAVYKRGYIIETLSASPYFFKDKSIIRLEHPCLLIVNNYLNDLEGLSNILNYVIETNKSIIIFAEDYSDDVINQSVNLFLNENVNLYLLKIPEYGKNKIDIINDLSLISQAQVVDDLAYFSDSVLGCVSAMTITREETIFHFELNATITNKIEELNTLKMLTNDLDQNFINRRLSMFQNGLAEIVVGAPTETERRELKMRCEDALYATAIAFKGIVPGSGIILYQATKKIEKINDASEIIFEALKEPFNQIMRNAGIDEKIIICQIEETNFSVIYNVSLECYENIRQTLVVDPTYVLQNALTNAISIAGMLLTTTSLIINEHQNNSRKISPYTEI